MPAPTAEHGRGLRIIDAVADNLRLTGNGVTTLHFEKALRWVPGAAGEQLLGRHGCTGPAAGRGRAGGSA
jgi:hypothetical protein